MHKIYIYIILAWTFQHGNSLHNSVHVFVFEEWVFEVVERITMDVQGKTIETKKRPIMQSTTQLRSRISSVYTPPKYSKVPWKLLMGTWVPFTKRSHHKSLKVQILDGLWFDVIILFKAMGTSAVFGGIPCMLWLRVAMSSMFSRSLHQNAPCRKSSKIPNPGNLTWTCSTWFFGKRYCLSQMRFWVFMPFSGGITSVHQCI